MTPDNKEKKREEVFLEDEETPPEKDIFPTEEWQKRRTRELKLKLKSLESRVKVLKEGGRATATATGIIESHEEEIKRIRRELEKLEPKQTDLFSEKK